MKVPGCDAHVEAGGGYLYNETCFLTSKPVQIIHTGASYIRHTIWKATEFGLVCRNVQLYIFIDITFVRTAVYLSKKYVKPIGLNSDGGGCAVPRGKGTLAAMIR